MSALEDLPSFTLTVHKDEIHYVRVGEGPVLVFIHSVFGTGGSWKRLLSLLRRDFTVIAPDLFGHGHSTMGRRSTMRGHSTMGGDYTLGGHAGRLRDLLDLLEVQGATLVGHSLGGGVAMTFGYLWRERCERLVLVSSGGLGREVSPILRALTLPGAERVLPAISGPWLLRNGERLVGRLGQMGMRSGPDLQKLWRGYVSLGEMAAQHAYLETLRTVVNRGGQTVSALERLPALVDIPTLLVWGARDPMIPVAHGITAQRLLPGSRLEVFDQAGHAPHLSDPLRFATLLQEFVSAASVGDWADRRHPRQQAGRLQVARP
jgi:pimeloyl-ACP methyl ester carboxylesterase